MVFTTLPGHNYRTGGMTRPPNGCLFCGHEHPQPEGWPPHRGTPLGHNRVNEHSHPHTHTIVDTHTPQRDFLTHTHLQGHTSSHSGIYRLIPWRQAHTREKHLGTCACSNTASLSLTLTHSHTAHTPKLGQTHQFTRSSTQSQTPASPTFLFCHVRPSGGEASPGEHSIALPSVPLQSWHQRPQSSEFFFYKGLHAQAPRPMGSGPIPGAGAAEASVAPTRPSLMSHLGHPHVSQGWGRTKADFRCK